MRRALALAGVFALALGLAVLPTTGAGARGMLPALPHLPLPGVRSPEAVADAIATLDLAKARSLLGHADDDDPAMAVEAGRLALYEGRFDDALVALGHPQILDTEAGAGLYEIARGSARATAATLSEADAARGVTVRFQDAADRPLFPLIADTVQRARDVLSRELGVDWPLPTRILVVRDLMSLSATTGLPLKSAETTGTVAVAKWGRVTLLSPRASEHGFGWRDTLAHELTHLAVTRATADRAPLWLQEGVAKREETRWRAPGPYDGVPDPDAVVARGIEQKLAIPLAELGPSIAMLPSADAAKVAYAEVTSFVRFLATEENDPLPRLLGALRGASGVDAALRAATGADLPAWERRWRDHIASTSRARLPAIFGLGADTADFHDLRNRVRLAQLLYGRGHAVAALDELGQARGEAWKLDPSVRSLDAAALAATDRAPSARRELEDPRSVASSFGPWWSLRGRLARAVGDVAGAERSFEEAVATDPFDVQAACEVDDGEGPVEQAPESAKGALCNAARARHEPPLGKE